MSSLSHSGKRTRTLSDNGTVAPGFLWWGSKYIFIATCIERHIQYSSVKAQINMHFILPFVVLISHGRPTRVWVSIIPGTLVAAVPSSALWADSRASRKKLSNGELTLALPPPSLCAFHLLLRWLWLTAIAASQSPILYLHHYFPYLGKLFGKVHKETLNICLCVCMVVVSSMEQMLVFEWNGQLVSTETQSQGLTVFCMLGLQNLYTLFSFYGYSL